MPLPEAVDPPAPQHGAATTGRGRGQDRVRLAYSSLGCPGASLNELLELGADAAYEGVELRCGQAEPVSVALDAAGRRAVRRAADTAGITPVAVASYVRIADAGADDAATVEAILAHARLAHDLAAPFLRIFPGGSSGTEADDAAVRRLSAAAPAASSLGVELAIETHDSHPRGADVARVLTSAGQPGTCAVWDVLHTWRADENPALTVEALGRRLGYVQVKDVPSRDDPTPVALGSGALPLAAIAQALTATGYAGWVSWEYERAWHPGAAPFREVASGGRQALARLLRLEQQPLTGRSSDHDGGST